MGTISIVGVREMGTHGVLPEERERSQPFQVDLELEVDVTKAAASDDLADTVDYGAVAEAVSRVVVEERFALLEALAARIGEVAKADPRVQTATVTVRKLHPPVRAVLDHVAVRITV